MNLSNVPITHAATNASANPNANTFIFYPSLFSIFYNFSIFITSLHPSTIKKFVTHGSTSTPMCGQFTLVSVDMYMVLEMMPLGMIANMKRRRIWNLKLKKAGERFLQQERIRGIQGGRPGNIPAIFYPWFSKKMNLLLVESVLATMYLPYAH